jgi:ribosome biogenesis protein ENP2
MKRHATFNDVKVYNVSAGKTLPEWTEEKKKKNISLRYNEEYRRRIELIHDFNFPVASNRLKITPDGQFIAAIGTYAPRCKIYETAMLGLKCERHMDAESVTFEMLSEDYSKMVFMRVDRTLEFHVKYGRYHTTRIPKFGRDLLYNPQSCDLYCACSGSEVYRMNLEEGRFLTGFETQCPAVNKVKANRAFNMVGLAGSDGRLECWDPRAQGAVGVLDAGLHSTQAAGSRDLTALEFAPDGLTLGLGTAGGECLLFDLRSSRPLRSKTHNYGLPICDLHFATGNGSIFSADAKILKVWDRDTGDTVTNIEPPGAINNFEVWPGTGLVLMAADTPKMQVFYVPSLGPAPKWCRFLDSLTEELEEEEHSSVYDDYKFVTRAELASLGLEHMVGTNVLRAYMHGFFLDARLYKKAKLIAQPFAYETYRQERVDEKIAAERESRIAPLKRLPKVNTKLAERMLSGKHQTKASKKEKADPRALLEDDRFASMWANKNFEVDEEVPPAPTPARAPRPVARRHTERPRGRAVRGVPAHQPVVARQRAGRVRPGRAWRRLRGGGGGRRGVGGSRVRRRHLLL